MAHLWISEFDEWTPRPLGGQPGSPLFPLPAGNLGPNAGVFLRRAAPTADTAKSGWHLLVPPFTRVRVNGEPVSLGIRALRDRDEIRVPGAEPMFFSNEELMAIQPFAGSPEGKCPRCAKSISPLSPAVRCAGCHTWYHQTEARACFSYGPNPICVLCGADTVVSGEYSWIPEGH
jgi:hypothetical protein